MSVGIDLGDLGTVSLVPDLGSAETNTWFDLGSVTINGVSLLSDNGTAELLPFRDLTNSLGTASTVHDQGPSFTQQFADTPIVNQTALVPQEMPSEWWRLTGFDTVALTTITWTGRTPLEPPPTPHTVNNISATKLDNYLPH